MEYREISINHMVAGVKEMKDDNQRGIMEQPKTPQPSESPEMLERLKQQFNVYLLAKSSLSTLFLSRRAPDSCCVFFPWTGRLLQILWCARVTEKRDLWKMAPGWGFREVCAWSRVERLVFLFFLGIGRREITESLSLNVKRLESGTDSKKTFRDD